MQIDILDTPAAAAARAADIIAGEVRARPDSVLGLATGATMDPVYADLVRRHRDAGLSFAGVTTFNLDEYVGLPPDHRGSYHRAMADALFDHVDLRPDRAFLPDGMAADPAAEADRYERLIAAAGGIDLQLLGLGRNGHIGFNEPGSDFASRCRVVQLDPDTRAANLPHFGPGEDTPPFAITMGIATILGARTCLLLATGAAKADAVARMIEGPVDPACPASALRTHPDVMVLLDRPAAAGLCRA